MAFASCQPPIISEFILMELVPLENENAPGRLTPALSGGCSLPGRGSALSDAALPSKLPAVISRLHLPRRRF